MEILVETEITYFGYFGASVGSYRKYSRFIYKLKRIFPRQLLWRYIFKFDYIFIATLDNFIHYYK